MILWAILAATTLTHLIKLVTGAVNVDAIGHYREQLRVQLRFNAVAMVSAFLGYVAVPALWTVYAVHVGDWRFAAIAWIPHATSAVVNLAARRAKVHGARTS